MSDNVDVETFTFRADFDAHVRPLQQGVHLIHSTHSCQSCCSKINLMHPVKEGGQV